MPASQPAARSRRRIPAPHIAFTQRSVEWIEPPSRGHVFYWDTVLPGFGLRVTARGRRTWIAVHRVSGKGVMETIGTMGEIPSVEDARALAREIKQCAMAGIRPRTKRISAQLAAAKATGRTLPSGQSVAQLYRQFNQEGELLYVGVSLNGMKRLHDHRDKSYWFEEIAVVTIEHFAKREEALAAENAAISEENPRYNVSGGIRVAALRERERRGR